MLPALVGGSSGSAPLWQSLLITAAKVSALVAFTGVVGVRVIPRLLDYVADTRSRELFTLTVLVMALAIAVGAAQLFGVSMALGAFLAGMVVGQSDFSSRAAAEALPMRDAFAVLFFVSVGMLFDPAPLWAAPGLVAATLAVILIGKPLAALSIVHVLGYPLRTALAVSVALAQIGEFSFILAALALKLKIVPADAYNVLVAAAIISISLNPLLYRTIDVLERHAKRWPALGRLLAGRKRAVADGVHEPEEPAAGESHAVVVGYGPVVGRSCGCCKRTRLCRR
jgi:CPA2 family monovalent cation:H+ antiporter-2